MVTDPISDMLTQIRNAQQARKEYVSVPYSALKDAVLKILSSEGYVRGVSRRGSGVKKRLVISLLYSGEGVPKITTLRRISKPSRRIYRKSGKLRPLRGGKGLLVVSTSKGVLSDARARKEGVGGEPLFAIW